MPEAIEPRFSPERVGAAYPLRKDELLQARSALNGAPGAWGRLFLRVTRESQRERAEYWFGSDHRFSTATDELTPEAMKATSDALRDLAAAIEGYAPTIDANDSGRMILFWKAEQRVEVFIPSHLTSYQPSAECLLAFDRLWSIITAQP